MTSRVPCLKIAICAATLLAAVPVAAQGPGYEIVRPNDNRARAGISSGGVLAVRIEARIAVWHPNGVDQPGAAVPVFAEMGRQAQIPGPMIRVPGGTDVIVAIRNAIPNRVLTVHGLHARPAVGAAFNDSIQLVPGQVSTLRFRLDRPGTYYYWGTTTGQSFGTRTGPDAQLTGVIVVDEPGQRTPRDRIFVVGMWADSAASEWNRHRQRELLVINGRAWPGTDRIQYERGDSVRWRVVNATADGHPMHLHGFDFRVNRHGDGRVDTVLATRDPVHTAYMAPGSTMSMSWLASRTGNWLFHCDEPAHVSARGTLGFAPAGRQYDATGAEAMGGMAAGVEILPAEADTAPPPPLPEPVRRIRMVLRSNIGTTPSRPFYSVAFSDSELVSVEPIGQSAGEALTLTRGDPVSIMIHNRTPEALTIHWHGLAVDSYYDGVAGFSGVRPEVAPAIAPNDSFEVRMTPERAGTFHYHAHASERLQRAGIVGPLIVTEPRHNSARELTVLVSSPSDSADEDRSVLVNGAMSAAPVVLRQGASYRLRLINGTTGRPALHAGLTLDSASITWRPVAKDGHDFPASRRTVRPAEQLLSIGETMDVEFFPTRAGDYRLEFRTPMGVVLNALVLRVE